MSYQDVKDKLYHGHRKIANNTYLKLLPAYYVDEFIVMGLHGNLIATFHPDHLELWSAGWYTRTTKDRLNLALELAGIPSGVRQRDWSWFYGTFDCIKPVIKFYDGMKIDYTGRVYS